MARFSVDPETLDTAAAKIQAIAEATASAPSATSADWGDPHLAEAAAEFTDVVGATWTEQLRELREIASRLGRTADAYEEADQESVPRTEELPG